MASPGPGRPNTQQPNISFSDLCRIIGEKEVTISMLNQKINELTKENDGMKIYIADIEKKLDKIKTD